MDWSRFYDEIGFTQDMFSAIENAVVKAGSTEKLKPIKNELPEEVSLIEWTKLYYCRTYYLSRLIIVLIDIVYDVCS